MVWKKILTYVFYAVFAGFLLLSYLTGFEPGLTVKDNFIDFTSRMLSMLPAAFILIGLFEVWVKKETVERHFGKEAGLQGFLWALILAGTTVGGTYVAFPVAYSLYQKGAKYSIIFTYIGASAIARIPMTLFEASFLGIKFSIIRLVISIPLIIISSLWLEGYLDKRGFKFEVRKD